MDTPRLLIRWAFAALASAVTASAAAASVYYDYDRVAITGMSSLVLIENEVSINDKGQVAFIGDQNAAAGFESVYVSSLGALATSINPTFSQSGRTFGPGVEINAAGRVGTRDSISGDSFLRLWAAGTGVPSILDMSNGGTFDSVGFRPGINDSGQATHGVTDSGSNFLVLADGTTTVAVSSLFETRPAIANNGSVVARAGMAGNATDQIFHFTSGGTATLIADTVAHSGVWAELGREPGISRDGSLVAWIGNRGMGLGVFIAPVTNPSNVIRVAGENGATPVPCPGVGCTTNQISGTALLAATFF